MDDHRIIDALSQVDYRTDPEGNVHLVMSLPEFEAFLETLNRARIVVREDQDHAPYLLKFEPMYLLNGKAAIKVETTEVEIVENVPAEPSGG